MPLIYREHQRLLKNLQGIHSNIPDKSARSFQRVCSSLMCSRKHWMSEVPALLLMHSEPTPKISADLVFVRACNHWSHSHQPQQMEFFSTAAHEYSNFTYTGFGASLEVLNQFTRDLQHKPQVTISKHTTLRSPSPVLPCAYTRHSQCILLVWYHLHPQNNELLELSRVGRGHGHQNADHCSAESLFRG